ncbi:hypothetical protein ACQP00_17030 [Dactylosporangium sp. CS-047395]|uniref:hypothetical protein n=1 Tax=Dactylosporangium sp. CS-047395 TaxID=3239936 RepID=UPI003D91F4BF
MRSRVVACAVLGAGWLVAVAVLTRAVLARVVAGLDAKPDPSTGRLQFVLAIVLVAGPLLVAGVARGLRVARLPRIALVVAGVTVLPAVILGLAGSRTLQTPEPEPTRQRCVILSGGTNTCPGG